ncbi:MAG: AI-2E family transporter [Planctomycetota bacterium]
MTETNGEQSTPTGDRGGLHIWQYRWVRDILVIVCIVLLLRLGQSISVVTVPVLLSILFAYLLEPVVAWVMNRFKLKRTAAVGATLVATISLVVVPAALALTYGIVQIVSLVTGVVANVQVVRGQLPTAAAPESFDGDDPGESAYAAQLEEGRAFVHEQSGDAWVWIYDKIAEAGRRDTDLGETLDTVSNWVIDNSERVATSVAGAGADLLSVLVGFTTGIIGAGFMLFLTAFFFFFVSSGWVDVKDFGLKLVPSKHRKKSVHLTGEFDRVISGFIRGRLIIAFLQSIVFTIGYAAIGVPAAFILGPAVALLSIVPYLALVGVPISIGLMFLETPAGFRGEWWWIIAAPTAFYFFAQAIDDYLWTPRIQGKETGMSTPAIVFASLAGGVLFGVFGLLIAIPIAACLKIAADELFWPRFREWAEGRANDPLPISED